MISSCYEGSPGETTASQIEIGDLELVGLQWCDPFERSISSPVLSREHAPCLEVSMMDEPPKSYLRAMD